MPAKAGWGAEALLSPSGLMMSRMSKVRGQPGYAEPLPFALTSRTYTLHRMGVTGVAPCKHLGK